MVNILLAEGCDDIFDDGKVITVLDQACGTGGMLSTSYNFIKRYNPTADVRLFGQEINPESYAICLAEMMIKGQNAENICYQDTMKKDRFKGTKMRFVIENPPFGTPWGGKDAAEGVEQAVQEEFAKGFDGRWGAGLPGSGDMQMLFLQSAIDKMDDNVGRAAIIENGSPLFTGGTASGESQIRRWMLENDYIEAIIVLTGVVDHVVIDVHQRFIGHVVAKVLPLHPSDVLVLDSSIAFALCLQNRVPCSGAVRGQTVGVYVAVLVAQTLMRQERGHKLFVLINLAVFILNEICVQLGDSSTVFGRNLIFLIAQSLAQFLEETGCVYQLDFAFALRALVLGKYPNVCSNAGVIEKVNRQCNPGLNSLHEPGLSAEADVLEVAGGCAVEAAGSLLVDLGG